MKPRVEHNQRSDAHTLIFGQDADAGGYGWNEGKDTGDSEDDMNKNASCCYLHAPKVQSPATFENFKGQSECFQCTE